ncbi:TPA: DUF6339 family protein [Serratia marcescens]
MPYNNLVIISQKIHDYLYDNVENNIERYLDGDFCDLYSENGWNININSCQVNMTILEGLDASSNLSSLDISNSMLVWQALSNLTPAMACDSRIWTRMSHVEALSFSRERWIKNKKTKEDIIKAIRTHFFARTLTQYRDDHSISRLWWSSWFANKIGKEEHRMILDVLFKRADTRLNIMDRSGITMRECLVRVVFAYIVESWPMSAEQMRMFLKAINFHGSGRVFEMLSEEEIREFLSNCMVEI